MYVSGGPGFWRMLVVVGLFTSSRWWRVAITYWCVGFSPSLLRKDCIAVEVRDWPEDVFLSKQSLQTSCICQLRIRPIGSGWLIPSVCKLSDNSALVTCVWCVLLYGMLLLR